MLYTALMTSHTSSQSLEHYHKAELSVLKLTTAIAMVLFIYIPN